MSETETLDVIETLEPSAQSYEIIIGDTTFTQTPLSFFRKIELFSVLADAIDKALSEGAVISELLDDMPGDTSDLKEADLFIKTIAKVIKYAPDLLGDIFCISLNIKRDEREYAKELFEVMDDETAGKIMNNFVEQNWDAMMDFFSKQVSPLMSKVSEKVQSRSMQSTPSKTSRRRTAKP